MAIPKTTSTEPDWIGRSWAEADEQVGGAGERVLFEPLLAHANERF